jgi:hypothetical protein
VGGSNLCYYLCRAEDAQHISSIIRIRAANLAVCLYAPASYQPYRTTILESGFEIVEAMGISSRRVGGFWYADNLHNANRVFSRCIRPCEISDVFLIDRRL